MSSACTFCRIARGELSAHLIADEPSFVAFLDHKPLFPGHVLVVPKAHVETLTDLPPAGIGPLFALVQRVARAVEAGMSADGYFMAANNRVSQSVPHLHIHVVPRRKKDGLKGFFWPRHGYSSQDEMTRVKDAIAAALPPGNEAC